MREGDVPDEPQSSSGSIAHRTQPAALTEDALRRLRERAARALGRHEVTEAVAKVRAIVGPAAIPASEPDAQAAWDKLRSGAAPSPNELAALEIVVRLLRPAPLSRGGALDDLPDQQGHNLYPPELKDAWSAFRTSVRPLLYSIGRINLIDGKHIGTGFVVGDGVLATNRHVLDDLTFGTGLLAAGQAQVAFQREVGATDAPEQTVPIEGVIRVHPTFDMALLAIPALGRPAVTLDDAATSEGVRVAVVGYPAKDEGRNPRFSAAIFGNTFGVKRAAIGEILDGSQAPVLFHDCSTLGGNSGSPVFSLDTGRVIGIHRSGLFMFRNEAVDGASLDVFVRGA
jgi:S1-C subfamily serine protease